MQEHADARLRAFVVWEPVLITDWAAPADSALSRISDSRAAQYWDRGRVLSELIRNTARSDPAHSGHNRETDDIVWDVAAVYPAGAKWESALPPHAFFDGPVVLVADRLREALRSALPNR